MHDYEALAARSFDEPLTADERAGLRVWGDALEWSGDPRGPLISLEHLVREQPERRHELHRAMTEHIRAHGGDLLGGFARFLEYKRAVELEWRSGLLYGAFLDTRQLARHVQLPADQLVAELVSAPFARTLRRLHVRVRLEAHIDAVLAVLCLPKHRAGRLQELVVMSGARPTAIIDDTRARDAEAMAMAYADLWLLVRGWRVLGLPLDVGALATQAEMARKLAHMVPSSRDGRVVLGRAVVHRDPEVRAAALDRIAALGPAAFMYVETLMLLLAPGLARPQAPIVACLATLGPRARLALPLLGTITGRSDHYDRETRHAARLAMRALRED